MLAITYLIASFLFIFGIKKLNRVKTARQGNLLSSLGMLLAIIATFWNMGQIHWSTIFSAILVGSLMGAYLSIKVQMTAMPQLVAMFNGLGGLASALVAFSVFWQDWVMRNQAITISDLLGKDVSLTILISIVIGTLTFSGSLIAFLKLNGQFNKSQLFAKQSWISLIVFLSLVLIGLLLAWGIKSIWLGAILGFIFLVASGLLGVLLVTPIGGADMPVVISLLNSYSGLAAAATGFVLNNYVLIVSGSLVGASGLILTNIMCQAMNRSLLNVCFGGIGTTQIDSASTSSEYENIKSYSPEEAALIFDGIQRVIIVPGYGLAVAQAQHSVKELSDLLESKQIDVRYAIHPVAGRMPGHMNVLLAEANVPYDQLFEMEKINSEFKHTDVVIILGANDVVNPVARNEKSSPIYGMPILNVDEARTVIMVKRSLSPGYAGIKNPLFENENTIMVFGDAKKVVDQLILEIKENL